MNIEGVNPAKTLSDISSSLSDILAESGDTFESIASSFGGTFDAAAELFNKVAEDDRITLLLNAKLDVSANLALSFESRSVSVTINEASMSLLAQMRDAYNITLGSFGDLHITPSVQLRLQVENTATPFDVIDHPSYLKQVFFQGDFEGNINIAMDYVPAEVALRAYLPDLTTTAGLEFDVRLDINLLPIRESKFYMFYSVRCLQLATPFFSNRVFRYQRST